METEKIFGVLTIVIITSFSCIFLNITYADPLPNPYNVYGYVHIDDAITKPDSLKLSFPSKDFEANLFDTGYYVIQVWDDIVFGETGNFYITLSGLKYIAEEKILILKSKIGYELDLTISTDSGIETDPNNEEDNQAPIADAGGPYYSIINETVYFDGSSSYDPDDISTNLSYHWEFGDGTTGSGVTPTHIYSLVGNYTLTLTVTDNENKANIDITYVNIEEESNETSNMKPVSDSGGPYYEIINIPITFDGSNSYDTDGMLVEYIWDFGDGHTGIGEIIEHEYKSEGRYDISLKVVDNNYDYDIDTSYVIITNQPNYPPNKPNIIGAESITINNLQNYSAESSDPDGDDIRYYFDWGDNSEIYQSKLVSNGTIIQTNHTWEKPGLYEITVYVEDEIGVTSESSFKNILVDAIFCSNIGILIDYTNDGIYDIFRSNITNNNMSTLLTQEGYLIDDDGDKNWDYLFNITTGSLTLYSDNFHGFTFLNNIPLFHVGLIIIAFLSVFTLIFVYKNVKKKPLKKSVYYTKEKATKLETKEEKIIGEKIDSNYIRLDEIEKRIDELIGKK